MREWPAFASGLKLVARATGSAPLPPVSQPQRAVPPPVLPYPAIGGGGGEERGAGVNVGASGVNIGASAVNVGASGLSRDMSSGGPDGGGGSDGSGGVGVGGEGGGGSGEGGGGYGFVSQSAAELSSGEASSVWEYWDDRGRIQVIMYTTLC